MAKSSELPKSTTPAPIDDPVAQKVAAAVFATEELRECNASLARECKQLESANLQLESEVASLKIMLEQERTERRHYHSLANELVTRLDVVGQTIHDAVKRAEQEVYRQRRENPRLDPEALPPIKLPSFLEKVEAIMSGAPVETVNNAPL